jgi:hypothetical protein
MLSAAQSGALSVMLLSCKTLFVKSNALFLFQTLYFFQHDLYSLCVHNAWVGAPMTCIQIWGQVPKMSWVSNVAMK